MTTTGSAGSVRNGANVDNFAAILVSYKKMSRRGSQIIKSHLYTLFPTAADIERNFFLNDSPAFDTLLHDTGTVVTGHHVETRAEEDSGGVVSAHVAVANNRAVVYELFAQETLFDSGRAALADCDVAARREENIAALVRAHKTLVEQLLVHHPHHAVAADDASHGLTRVAIAHRAFLQSFAQIGIGTQVQWCLSLLVLDGQICTIGS